MRVQPVHAMNKEQRQMAADLWTKLTDLRRRPAGRVLRTTGWAKKVSIPPKNWDFTDISS